MSGIGEFAGKYVMAASTTSPFYLTTQAVKRKQGPLYLPSMSATAVTPKEHCVFYQTGTPGHLFMRLGSLMWVCLETDLGWLMATDDPAQAVPMVLAGDPLGRILKVATTDGDKIVYYSAGGPTPYLTINPSSECLDTFSPNRVTPGLDVMRSSGGKNADMSSVLLGKADLSGIDFQGANFTRADLSGATLDRGNFSRALFMDAVLTGITANGATLDGANLGGADLAGTNWGKPASAKEIKLDNVKAAGAVLGVKATPLDCTGASLTGAQLDGADLSGLVLTKASLGQASLMGAVLDGAVLDDADLGSALMLRASLKNASMKRTVGHGANLMASDLSYANLNQAQFGSRAYLFALPGSDATFLDGYAFPQPQLVADFKAKGTTLSGSAPIAVLDKGKSWSIDDKTNGPFTLKRNDGAQIDVYLDAGSLRPASFGGALCLGTQAASAILTGVDFRRVRWYGNGATLDHADLEGASLSNSLLVGTKFTQAFLSGADFSGSILAGADFRGCVIRAGSSRQPAGFDGAQLQGAVFTQATLLDVILFDAGAATADGVPLLALPSSDARYLTTNGITNLAAKFSAAGYPLGTGPAVTDLSSWLIDNGADPNTSSPRSYQVKPGTGQLDTYNGEDSTYLFSMNNGLVSILNSGKADNKLKAVFLQNSYTLAPQAPIAASASWRIDAGTGQPLVRAVNYPTMRVLVDGDALQVYGVSLMMLRDWPGMFPSGVAFSGSTGLDGVLSQPVIGPAGFPYSAVTSQIVSWIVFLRAGG